MLQNSAILAAILIPALAGDLVVAADTAGEEPSLPPIYSYRATDIASLRQGFAAPPREAGPWVFWIFFENVMSKAEITRELEEMAAAGIAGAELRFLSMHGFSGKPGPGFDPEGWARLGQKRLEFLSPEFVDALEHACAEAQRLGLRLAINTGMGWPPGGPWITPQYRSKHLAWQAREISGPKIFEEQGASARLDGPGVEARSGWRRQDRGGGIVSIADRQYPMAGPKRLGAMGRSRRAVADRHFSRDAGRAVRQGQRPRGRPRLPRSRTLSPQPCLRPAGSETEQVLWHDARST